MPWRDAEIVGDWSGPVEENQPLPPTSRVASALTGFAQGATMGFADEAAAGLAATVKRPFSRRPWRELYEEQLAIERGNLGAAQEEFPGTTMAGSVAGGVGTGVRLAGAGATLMGGARSIPGAVGRGAAEGAIYGGLYGAGTAEEGERLGGAAQGAAIGAAGGGLAGGLGGAVAARQRPRVPEIEALRQQADAAYTAARKAGVVVSERSFKGNAARIAKRMADEGIDPTLHPRASAALRRLQEADGAVDLQGIDTLRRVVRAAGESETASERRLAHIMTEMLDGYVDRLGTRDLVGTADPVLARESLKTARNLWSRKSKGEVIEHLMDRAGNRAGQFSGSGYENAIRTEFRNLAQSKSRMRQFNKAEQDAIRKVARGGPVGNALRMIGKAAPTSIVSGALGAGAGYAAAGPVGGVAVPLTGAAARMGATAITTRNARLASELVRMGVPPEQLPMAVQAMSGFIAGSQPVLQGGDE